MNENFVPSRTASKILGLHHVTIRKYAKEGKIKSYKTDTGKYMYNVQEYIRRNSSDEETTDEKLSICYCRVSTRNQKDDLQRQIEYMQEKFPTHTIIKDIGSGINFKKKGLCTILDLAYKGKIKEVVVAYKDRLCRIGFELIQYILEKQSNAKIVVLHKKDYSPEQEITQDLLQIINVFSARVNGLRKYNNKIKNDKDIPKPVTEKNS